MGARHGRVSYTPQLATDGRSDEEGLINGRSTGASCRIFALLTDRSGPERKCGLWSTAASRIPVYSTGIIVCSLFPSFIAQNDLFGSTLGAVARVIRKLLTAFSTMHH